MPFTRLTLALLIAGGMACAQAPATAKPAAVKAPTLNQVLDRDLAGLEGGLVPRMNGIIPPASRQ